MPVVTGYGYFDLNGVLTLLLPRGLLTGRLGWTGVVYCTFVVNVDTGWDMVLLGVDTWDVVRLYLETGVVCSGCVLITSVLLVCI